MDVPQHVLRTLFRDTAFPLIQHHVDSYNDMIENRIPAFIKASNPHELELPDKRFIRVYIGGKTGDKLRWESPVNETDFTAVLPHACRLNNRTYAVTLYADLEIEYSFPTVPSVTKVFKDQKIGDIPLMLRSKKCYLTGIDGYTVGECKFELGGYFIIDGSEKVLLTQEGLGNNMFYSGKRQQLPTQKAISRAAEKEMGYKEENPEYISKEEYTAGIRSVSEDASRGPFSHFLIIPPETEDYVAKRVAMITLPGFEQPVPVFSVFRALGLTADKDVYDATLIGVPEQDRLMYDTLFYQLVLSHERASFGSDLEVLTKFTRTHSRPEIVRNLHDLLFPHVEGDTDTGALYRRKAYQLGRLLKMAMDVALGVKAPSDRDHFKFKRMETSGDLCFKEFRRIFRDTSKNMLLELDKRVNQFERAVYAGDKLVTVFREENISFYWRDKRLLNEFLKSFKGSWGGRDGIAQELSRTSYAGVVSHLRRTNLAMDRTSNKPEPRRYHASQVGLMCPVDSPDGRNIGYIKSLALFARISTPVSIELVKGFLKGFVKPTADIHPSTWDPTWTPVFVNSDLVGACMGRSEELHAHLVAIRRTQSVGMSLGWDRVSNVYTITCDGGRPIRPVYREGTTEDMIRSAKGWTEIAEHLDYIDALETEVLRISLTPFHPRLPSELHMMFNLSAMTSLIPFSDHNPGTRNAFAIAQLKTTCAWFHTNYLKRFDTIAAMAALPQIPLTQTWAYREIMGAGGCMPHGENCLVAITTYGGYNQEDSVMINQTAMDRGMFQTLYFHSYDFEEDMVDTENHTEFANLLVNPLYKDSVKRKDAVYDHLDAEGLIKVGSLVTEDTVLVGMVSPSVDAAGKIKGYRDVSILPKRGQHGRVDAVYRYDVYDEYESNDPDKPAKRGLRGVKIRIVEERFPVIGDKMGSRHSQKGTCGLVLPEEDMPFTARGVRPDVIFNPHALPTRMTIGHWMESSWSRLALKLGAFVDATPFTTSNRSETLKKIMLEQGFEPYGSEILYNGMTGEMMNADIFMGPTYYQRMKYMVEDKINARSTGPRKLLTHQPLEGRADEGGLRIGEMERDALISHGMAKFLHESLMDRSDAAEFQYDQSTERLDTSRVRLAMPYCAGLYTRELESLHINVQLKTE